MQPLIRLEFRPKLWSAADLDAVADHRLWLFDQAPATAGRDADHRTELRLRGVPNADRDAVAAALATRLPDADVRRPDADTLTAVGPKLDFDATPPAGLGVPALAGPPFDGLYLEARFTATARKRNGKPHAAGTLVLAGELGPEGFTVYAVWAEVGSALVSQQAINGPWADEQAWRTDAEYFRANRPVVASAAKLAAKLFPKPAGRPDRACVWIVQFPFTGERRPLRFVAKVLTNLGLIAAAAALAWSIRTHDDFVTVAQAILVASFAFLLGLLLCQFLFVWVLARRQLRGVYAIIYGASERLVKADRATASLYFDNPAGRKMTADWDAAGARRLADATFDAPALSHVGFRLSHAADGKTVIIQAACTAVPGPGGTTLNRFWPASMTTSLMTRFPDDSAVGTTDDSASGFRRKLTGPELVGRACRGVTDPVELLALHAEACRRHAERTGQTSLPAMDFEGVVRWQADSGERDRRLYAHNPVTWSDAFVLLMGYVRRAYR